MIDVVEVPVPPVGKSGAGAFAAACRSSSSQVTAICRPGIGESVECGLGGQLTELFRWRPALAAVALMHDAAMAPGVLASPVVSPGDGRRRWPVALVVDTRVAALVLDGIEESRDDPWLEVIDRLLSREQVVEWRPAHLPGAPPTWPPPGALPALDASLAPSAPAWLRPGPPAEPVSLGYWHRLWVTEDGVVPQAMQLGGTRPDESWQQLCSVLDRDVSGATRVMGLDGWVRHDGLPGGVALMRYHDADGNDVIDHVETASPPGPPQEILGWGLATASALAEPPAFLPADAVAVECPVGEGQRAVFLHQTPRPATRAVFRDVQGVVSASPSPGSQVIGHLSIERRPGLVFVGTPEEPIGYAPAVVGRLSPRPVARLRDDWYPTDRALPARVKRRAKREAIQRRASNRNVLLVLPWFTIGGADLFFLALVQDLVARGYRVHAVFTYPTDEDRVDHREALLPHLESLRCPADDEPGRSIGDVVRDVAEQHRIGQMIICGGWQVYEHLPRLRFELPGVRVIDQLFNDVGHLDNNRRYSRWIDLTVCAYDGLASLLVNGYGEDPHRVRSIYIGIDTDHYRPVGAEARRELRVEMGFDPDRPVWGYSGRVSEEKCLPDFVAALDLVGDDLPAQFLIQGDGPGLEAVRDALDGCRCPVVTRSFQPDQRPTLQMLDAYVLPSRVEGIPLALMEAMSCGALPIATAVGGIPDLVMPGVTGYLAAPQHPGSLAAALLAAGRTPEWMRSEMAHEGRQRIRREMTWSRTVESYLAVLGSA